MYFIRRAAIGLGIGLVGLIAAAAPAAAASGSDGTSNTIQLSVTSAGWGQAQDRLVVAGPAMGGVDARLMEEDGIYPPFA
jgi:hypothetical protein